MNLKLDHSIPDLHCIAIPSWGVKIKTSEIEIFLVQRGVSIGQQEPARSIVIRLLARRIGILPTELAMTN